MSKHTIIALVAGVMLLGTGYALAADKTLQQQCEESAREASDGNAAEIQSYIEACLAEYGSKIMDGGAEAPKSGGGAGAGQ